MNQPSYSLLALLASSLLLASCQQPAPAANATFNRAAGAEAKQTEKATDIIDLDHADLSEVKQWTPAEFFAAGFISNDPHAISSRIFSDFHHEILWRIRPFLDHHQASDLSLTTLLSEYPLWYRVAFPDGTELLIKDLAVDPVPVPGSLNLRLSLGGVEGALYYPGEMENPRSFKSSFPEELDLVGARTTSALFSTTDYLAHFVDDRGRLPASYQEMCEFERITPTSALHLHSAEVPWNEIQGFRIELNQASNELRSLEVMPNGDHVVRLYRYEPRDGIVGFHGEALELGAPRSHAPGFTTFIEASVFP